MINVKNIVFIGMMGSGKTAIGKMVSQRLSMDFIDLDDFIEESENKTIKEMFDIGEAFFREREKKAVMELAKKGSRVISTGGGVIKDSSNMRVLKKNGIIVFLDRPIDDIAEDIDILKRPLLLEGLYKLYELHEERYELYKMYADIIIDNNTDIETLVDDIIYKVGVFR